MGEQVMDAWMEYNTIHFILGRIQKIVFETLAHLSYLPTITHTLLPRQTDRQTDKQMDGWMDEWMDGWVDGWMDGWVGGWVDV